MDETKRIVDEETLNIYDVLTATNENARTNSKQTPSNRPIWIIDKNGKSSSHLKI